MVRPVSRPLGLRPAASTGRWADTLLADTKIAPSQLYFRGDGAQLLRIYEIDLRHLGVRTELTTADGRIIQAGLSDYNSQSGLERQEAR